MKVGDIIATNYGTGPYLITKIDGPCKCPGYLARINPSRPRPSEAHYHITCRNADGSGAKGEPGNSYLNGYRQDGTNVWSKDKLIFVENKTMGGNIMQGGNLGFQEIALTAITPNPHNPRTCFTGTAFDELVASIKKQGVIEPVIVRALGLAGTVQQRHDLVKSASCRFELVAGERRFRASKEAGKETIPALVRDLTDDEAFDIMTIENLQRENLNPLEEARAFRLYCDRRGEDAVADLAQRTGINRRYIQRRVAVLALPENILSLWETGALLYGHLEQLLRLSPEEIPDIFATRLDPKRGTSWNPHPVSIAQLAKEIDNRATPLKQAMFDAKKGDCKTCRHNSTMQASMFGDDLSGTKARCNDPSCFREKQRAWLTEHWPAGYNELKTNGFVFDFERRQGEMIWEYMLKDRELDSLRCTTEKCKSFVTQITLAGKVNYKWVCLGEKVCYAKVWSASPGQSGASHKVCTHGFEFQDWFYRARIREAMVSVPFEDPRSLRLVLFALLRNHHNGKEALLKEQKFPGATHAYGTDMTRKVWAAIETMKGTDLAVWIVRTVQDQLLDEMQIAQSEHGGGLDYKPQIAAHLGIDIASEWRLNEDYLRKKTSAEIIALGNSLEILTDPKALAYLKDTIKQKKWENCKKRDLVDAILKSGVDLAGKVPQEILDTGKRDGRETMDDGREEEYEDERCFYLFGRTNACDPFDCCLECDDEACVDRCKLEEGSDECIEASTRRCRVCGCTEFHACPGGCSWVEFDLCSACIKIERLS